MSGAPIMPAKETRPRLESVDLLRGIVMVLMVLDHTRDFFGQATRDAVDPATTTVPLFFTRWCTHFCAPTFVFLAGTGAYLAGSRGMSRRDLSRFLFVRGIWLALLEVTFVRLGLTFDLKFQAFPLTVLWAIGLSMVALSVLVWLPTAWVAAFGVAMIVSHNAFDAVRPESLGRWADAWRVLHVRATLSTEVAGRRVFALYPLIPWIGVMAAGYGFGRLVTIPDAARRRRLFLAIGLALTAAFLALRGWNRYGDPLPWNVQDRGPTFTLLSFLNCQKYPPSLAYLLMTLGPAIALLALLDRGIGPIGRPLITFGRVPLFYYLLQWPLIHALAIGFTWLRGGPYEWLLANGPFNGPEEYGYSLPVVYAMWGVVVLLLYWPCRLFADLKRRRRDAWLSFF